MFRVLEFGVLEFGVLQFGVWGCGLWAVGCGGGRREKRGGVEGEEGGEHPPSLGSPDPGTGRGGGGGEAANHI